MSLENRLSDIQNRISRAAKKSNRSEKSVQIVAVSKTWPVEIIREVAKLGIQTFAENYVQEALPKLNQLQNIQNIHWHFIGALQSNKVKSIVGKFALIQSVDRLSLVEELQKRCTSPQKILMEVQVLPEAQKSGVSIKNAPKLIEKIQTCDKLILQGLMLMPPLESSIDVKHKAFERAQKLTFEWEKLIDKPHSLKELSMGTSQDFEIAIEHGSTMVRLGTILFGERTYE